MDTILGVGCLCLLLLLFLAVWHIIHLKRELRHFSAEVDKRMQEDYQQPIKLNCFDEDIVSLAVSLNRHIDLQMELASSYRADKRELANIISGISHDFRTPLTAALGYLQLIEKNEQLSPRGQEYLEIAIQKNEYLKQLSDDFFEISKVENHNEELVMEPINLSNLVSETVLEQYHWIADRGIQTYFTISDAVMLQSNLHFMKRILDNLFSNAEKYAVKHLSVTLHQQGDTVQLRVSNDVEDSDAIDPQKVFLPFYRASSRNKTGSGLGLYVVKCLADKLGMETSAFLDEKKHFTICLQLSNAKT